MSNKEEGKQEVDSKRPPVRVLPFTDSQTRNMGEFLAVISEEAGSMKDAVIIWEDHDNDIWYCSTKMYVSELVGLIEMAKWNVINNYGMEE